MSITYTGVLYGLIETGSEGRADCWMLDRDGMQGYSALIPLKDGDHLKIFNDAGQTVLFDGIIHEEKRPGFHAWTQKGWKPDDWAALFMSHDPPLRAELTKR